MNTVTELFRRLRRTREAFRQIQANSPGYLRVLHYDVQLFRLEVIKTSLGLTIGAIAGMSFVCFASAAVLVTTWDSRLRIAAAWSICVFWALISIAAFVYVRRTLRSPVPFNNVIRLLQQDLASIEKQQPWGAVKAPADDRPG